MNTPNWLAFVIYVAFVSPMLLWKALAALEHKRMLAFVAITLMNVLAIASLLLPDPASVLSLWGAAMSGLVAVAEIAVHHMRHRRKD